MSVSMTIFFVALAMLGYLVAPASLIWGWVRWARAPKLWSVTSALSMVGFLLATGSGLLAVSILAYAQVHHFSFYDPFLMRIFRQGFLLSVGGFVFALGGIWRKNALRWFALASAVGTCAFWLIATMGE